MSVLNRILTVVCILFLGFVILCMSALTTMGHMAEDMDYNHSTPTPQLTTSHDNFVRNTTFADGY